LTVIVLGALIYLIWVASQPVLLAMASIYVASGIVIRVGGIVRRHLRHAPPPPHPEHQIG
jgi:CDP-diacylglycerol--serine O-phosphatidyltransferase